jgi:hypothetical protein
MKISFSSDSAARAAVTIIEKYGYTAAVVGTLVCTDCPGLLAVPAISRAVGLHRVENVQFAGGDDGAGQGLDHANPAAGASGRDHAQPAWPDRRLRAG